MSDTLFERLAAQYPENFADCFDFSIGRGWEPMVETLVHESVRRDPHIRIEQVKEKFGELRFYAVTESESVRDLIQAVEEDSAHTCESCGAPAVSSSRRGWILTLCEACENVETGR